MSTIDRDELSVRSGARPDLIDRFVESGLLATVGGGSFTPGDVPRARMILALLSSGIELEDLGHAVEDGAFSLGFADRTMANPVSLLGSTYAKVFAEHGVEPELGTRLCVALGLPFPSPEAPIREDDAELIELIAGVLSQGLDPESIVRAVRVYSDGLRRIALTMREVFRANVEQKMLDAGLSRMQMLDAAATVRVEMQEAGFRALSIVLRRQLEGVVFENIVEHVVALLEDTGVRSSVAAEPPAIAFLDLVSFTSLTETEGDAAAARHAVGLAGIVQEAAATWDGRAVKLLGDGAMLRFPNPTAAVRCSVELVEWLPGAGLPHAHVGIDAGPIVERDGDCFGRTVNLAARLSAGAEPDQILASDAAVSSVEAPELEFASVGDRRLRGFAEPVAVVSVARR